MILNNYLRKGIYVANIKQKGVDTMSIYWLKRLKDIHFYGAVESIIKVPIWWVAWLGGIKSVNESNPNDRIVLGGAFLFFSLALLMEFVELRREYLLGRIIHTVFCLVVVIILLGGVNLLFCKNDFVSVGTLHLLSLGILIYLTLDLILHNFIGTYNINEVIKTPDLHQSFEDKQALEMFNRNATQGNLGSAEEGN